MKRFAIFILAASALLYADAKAPTLSDALKVQFFKAQAQLVQANAQAQEKQKAYAEAIEALTKACGEGYQLQMNAQQDPVCVSAPKAPEKKPTEK